MPRKTRDLPWIDRRGEVFYVFWYDKNITRTRRFTLRTRDEAEARIRFAHFLNKGIDAPRGADITVSRALSDYEREHRDMVDTKRTGIIIKHLKGFFKETRLCDVDVPMCRAYSAHRGVADSTIARELTVLKAATGHARKWKRITLDKMPTFEMPKGLPKRETWLLIDELRHVLSIADDDMYRFIRLTYETASRRAAIEQLQWFQLNFQRKTINLSKPGQKVTKKRRPTVPMGNCYDMLVEMYREKSNEWVLGSPRDRSEQFQRLMDKAGLLYVEERDGRPPGKITPHVLRHSRATHLLEAGASIYAVAKLLGDNPMTVQRVYGHIAMSSLEDELSKGVVI